MPEAKMPRTTIPTVRLGLATALLAALTWSTALEAQSRKGKPRPRPPAGQLPPGSLPDRSVPPTHARTTIDPCQAATQDQLETVLHLGLSQAFPIRHSDRGQHVRVSNPTLNGVDCPNLRIRVRADIRYQKTRGFPQFSTTGKLRFTAPVVAHVTHTPGLSGTEMTPADVVYAEACIQDVTVTELNLRRIPNWLDNSWIRNRVNDRFRGRSCTDITQWVHLYMQAGHELPI